MFLVFLCKSGGPYSGVLHSLVRCSFLKRSLARRMVLPQLPWTNYVLRVLGTPLKHVAGWKKVAIRKTLGLS